MAAPSLSASGRMSRSKFSREPRARPPETTTRAAPNTGRSLATASRPTKVEPPAVAAGGIISMLAVPPEGAGSKALVRTVMTVLGSSTCRVSMALPA